MNYIIYMFELLLNQFCVLKYYLIWLFHSHQNFDKSMK
jgi:hypothetical protein